MEPGVSLRQKQRRRGAAMVETALVLPIFFAVIFGIFEFGRAFMVAQLITNAAREGARTAIVGDSTNAAVTTQIKAFLLAAGKINGNDVTVTFTITPYPGNPAASDVSSATSRDTVQVTIAVPFEKVSLLPPKFLKNKSLTGTASMRYE